MTDTEDLFFELLRWGGAFEVIEDEVHVHVGLDVGMVARRRDSIVIISTAGVR